METTTEFFSAGGPRIEIGPVPGRKKVALAVGRDGSPVHKVVAYFRDEEAAEEFRGVLIELSGAKWADA